MTDPAQSLAELVARFRPEAALDLRATYQLHLDGDQGGSWFLTIADRQCHLSQGLADTPDVTITMGLDDWHDLIAGRLDGVNAYLAGRIRIAGDLSLVTRIPSLFGL